jgi:hypothetical protein
MHPVLNSPQLPQNRPAAPRGSAKIYWPRSERRYYAVEPPPHRLFDFRHGNRTKYHFKSVNLEGNRPNHTAHLS